MTIGERDKRALMILGGALAVWLAVWLAGSSSSSKAAVIAPVDTVERAEKRLADLRKTAATVAGKEAALKQAMAQLGEREKGLIQADTAAQAKEKLLQIIRKVAVTQTPPLDVRPQDLGQPKLFGDAYGEVSVTVATDCRIESVVNFLASLSELPDLVATSEIRLGAANLKTKIMPVRLTISGIVPRGLVAGKVRKEGFEP
ncbi:MAG: hypothetical protein M3O35_09795 [Acidobacteriota bacterium]|nr:hypothetical protein [Acidobacteriota bacterium]